MRKVAPHDCGLLVEPSRSNAEEKPPTREVVQCRHLLGQVNRMVLWDETNAGPQLQRLGHGRGTRQAQAVLQGPGTNTQQSRLMGAIWGVTLPLRDSLWIRHVDGLPGGEGEQLINGQGVKGFVAAALGVSQVWGA